MFKIKWHWLNNHESQIMLTKNLWEHGDMLKTRLEPMVIYLHGFNLEWSNVHHMLILH